MMRIILLILLFLAACTNSPAPSSIPSVPESTPATEGYILFAIKDKAFQVGSSAFNVDIESVQLGDKTFLINKEFDLLQLKDTSALITQKKIPAGTYDSITLTVRNAYAETSGTKKEAFMPTKDFKFSYPIKIEANKVTAVLFDFIIEQSTHTTRDDKLVFAPVIALQTANNVRPTVDSKGVTFEKELKMIAKYGTSVDGDFGIGESIWAETELILPKDKLSVNPASITQPEEKPEVEERKISMYRNVMNPSYIELKQDKLIRLVFESRDHTYTIDIPDMNETLKINQTSPAALDLITNPGTYSVRCSPCYQIPERKLGQIIIK